LEVTLEHIIQAKARLNDIAIRTPLLESPWINQHVQARVLFKAEVLQHTGSFKFRGAYNALSALEPQVRKNGVVAYSSGNHAQAVARVAQLFGCPAWIVMPSDAPKTKIEGTRFYGAEVILYNRDTENRDEIAMAIAHEKNAALIPPFDHPHVIAGQGTVGLEIVEQLQEKANQPDLVLIPCSGGGLSAGCATAIKSHFPATHIYSVEPEGYDDTALSLRLKSRTQVTPSQKTICDALMLTIPGQLTFSINQSLLSGGLSTSDEVVYQAMRLLFEKLKLVVEPGGAVGLATLLSGAVEVAGKTVVIVLSGGNVDDACFSHMLEKTQSSQ
jgi:threonine dehydratase